MPALVPFTDEETEVQGGRTSPTKADRIGQMADPWPSLHFFPVLLPLKKQEGVAPGWSKCFFPGSLATERPGEPPSLAFHMEKSGAPEQEPLPPESGFRVPKGVSLAHP